MYIISKTFSFAAAHYLEGLPENHPCSRVHGHNYTVRVILSSQTLDDVGMVLDYRRLDFVKKMLDNEFDHRMLNEVVAFNPTAENLARYFCERVKSALYVPSSVKIAVEVKETDKTSAIYED